MINRQGIKSILSAYQSRGIGRRFAIYILMFSSVVTLTITIIQLLYDYRRDVGILNDQLQEIQIIYQDTLSTSVWVHNKTGLNLQLEGMMRLPTIRPPAKLKELTAQKFSDIHNENIHGLS